MNMMKYKLVFLLITLIVHCDIFAQRTGIGYAVDSSTGMGMPDSSLIFKLLSCDSTEIYTRTLVQRSSSKGKSITKLYANLTKEEYYILYLAHPDFEPIYHPVKIPFHKREMNPSMGTVYMNRIMKTDLKEVTVKATKLKFYFKEDTLVYNTDVFMTQDGFMLDDILKKMPGITFKGGEIFSNGRKIDALLLNGKDFFNKDRKTILHNLPAYMVKNIIIYDKTKDSQSKYERERDFEGLVMDIKLKREYNQSTLGNMGIGAGTDKRYMGRAFGMKMHDLYRISVFAGSNNVGNNELGGYNHFASNTSGSEEKKNHFGGFNYNVDEKDGKFSIDGNLHIQGEQKLNIKKESKEMFFTEGNVFNYTSQRNNSQNFAVYTRHNLTLLQNTPWSFSITPSFKYSKSKSRVEDYQLSAEKNLSYLIGYHWQDSIFSSLPVYALEKYGISRMGSHSLQRYNEHQEEIKLNKRFKIEHTPDHIELAVNGYHYIHSPETFSLYNVKYYKKESQQQEYRRQFHDTYKDEWHWDSNISYFMIPNANHSLNYALKYAGNRHESDDLYYNLNELKGWGIENLSPLDSLPAEKELESVKDYNNSKFYIQHEHTYTAEVTYNTSLGDGFGLTATAAYDIRNRRLDFFQTENNSKIRKTLATPKLYINHNKQTNTKKKWGYNLNYRMESQMPSLLYMVEQKNDANILSVFLGNPDLKHTTTHQINGGGSWYPKPMENHKIDIGYYYMNNPVSLAFLYDKKTGKFTYKPMNVGFSRTLTPAITNSLYLDKEYKNCITNRLSVSLSNSLGLSGMDMEEYMHEYSLRHTMISEQFSYNFMSKDTKYRASVNPFVTWMKSCSDRPGESNIEAWHFGIQLNGQMELPWSIRLNTEINTICRQGYADKYMNDNEVTWNLSATKAFKEKFSLKLEGYDLLNQRKNVYYAVTPQGRTETIRNVLRRYAMMHFVWKFTAGKKKK